MQIKCISLFKYSCLDAGKQGNKYCQKSGFYSKFYVNEENFWISGCLKPVYERRIFWEVNYPESCDVLSANFVLVLVVKQEKSLFCDVLNETESFYENTKLTL